MQITEQEALIQYEPMVRSIANSAAKTAVCTKEDLEQEGRLAIIRALRTYEPDKGASLTTWMYSNIRSAILQYQKENLYQYSGGWYLASIIRSLEKRGEEPTVENLIKAGVRKPTAMASILLAQPTPVPLEELEIVDETADQALQPHTQLPWEQYLNDEERFVVGLHFGFTEENPINVGEIANRMQRSRKFVNNVLERSLAKLRGIPGIENFR